MLDVPEFDRWSAAARDTRRAAQVQADAGGHNWACFLSEQAAQLGVKAALHGIGAGAWGHDLVRLGADLEAQLGKPLPGAVQAALRRLARHYIPARYPDAHPSGPPASYYGPEDSAQALGDADAILAFLASAWQRVQEEDQAQ